MGDGLLRQPSTEVAGSFICRRNIEAIVDDLAMLFKWTLISVLTWRYNCSRLETVTSWKYVCTSFDTGVVEVFNQNWIVRLYNTYGCEKVCLIRLKARVSSHLPGSEHLIEPIDYSCDNPSRISTANKKIL